MRIILTFIINTAMVCLTIIAAWDKNWIEALFYLFAAKFTLDEFKEDLESL
jgi:hypothetical protein